MKRQTMICLLNLVVAATAAGVYGGMNIDPNTAAAQAGVTFPKIPGLNSPIFGFSLFPPRNGPNGPNDRGGPRGPRGPSNFGDIFRSPFSPPAFPQFGSLPSLPNVTDLIPELPNVENITSIFIPPISGPLPLSLLPQIPGLFDASQEARNHLESALGLGNDFVDGIQKALEEAVLSSNPTAAVRTLINTILDAYLKVAENCPMIVVGTRVLQEGIRLAGEVAKAARNVILGPS